MRIRIASDHAGFALKAALATFLHEAGHEIVDMGPYELQPLDDYPDYCVPLAHAVVADPVSLGVVIGFSGQGEAMACNRVVGARAAVYYGGPEEILRLSREHNDANILSLGAKFLTQTEAEEAVSIWIAEAFSHGERHVRRVEKLDQDIRS